jgi:dUTP pyrophosphatase
MSAATASPGGHHHHGTHNRSEYRTICGAARVSDTPPRVISSIVSNPLAVVRLDRDLPMPSRAHDGDAGIDLFSAIDVELAAGHRQLVPTGVAVAIPYGMVGLVHPRSGLAARVGLSIVNSPGTIDAGYRGEIKVSLINLDPEQPIIVHRGDRIAQLLVQRVELPELVEVTSFDEAGLASTSRGDGGHGSSGGHASL